MTYEFLKIVLGSGSFVLAVAAVVGGIYKAYQYFRNQKRLDDRDATWEVSEARRLAADHLQGYDLVLRSHVVNLEELTNQMRRQLNLEPIVFEPLPDPRDYPLFPTRDQPKAP